MSALKQPVPKQPVPNGANDDNDPPDWWEIERKFVHGHLTGPRLATQEHVDYAVLHKRCTRGGWVQKRREFQARLDTEAGQAEINRRNEAAAVAEQDAKDIARRAMQKFAALIDGETDLSKLRAGMAGMAATYRLLREVDGLPKEKPEVTASAARGNDLILRRDHRGRLYIEDPVTAKAFFEDTADGIPTSKWMIEAANATEALEHAAAPEKDVEEPELPDPADAGRAGTSREGSGPAGTSRELPNLTEKASIDGESGKCP